MLPDQPRVQTPRGETLSQTQRFTRLAVCVALGAVLWWLGAPAGLEVQAWRIFAVFISVIAGFVIRPMAMGPIVIVGMVVLMTTKTLTAEQMMVGYGNKTTWLIVAAFLIAGAVLRTGLGTRLALLLVNRLGHSMLGLGYALCGAELILGPVIPSNTARGRFARRRCRGGD